MVRRVLVEGGFAWLGPDEAQLDPPRPFSLEVLPLEIELEEHSRIVRREAHMIWRPKVNTKIDGTEQDTCKLLDY